MSSDIHQLSLIDLIMISQIYNVKFIIMNNKTAYGIPSRLICMGTTNTVNDDYILLYKMGPDDYQIIGNTAFSPAKYIFTKEELPTKLYQLWIQVCGLSDMKPLVDDHIPLLFNAPLYKTFNIAPTDEIIPGVEIKATSAKTYFVDPKTDMVLAIQSTKKKIPLKPKISADSIKATPEEDKIKAKVVEIFTKQKIPLKYKDIVPATIPNIVPATAPVVDKESKVLITLPPPVLKKTIKKKSPVPTQAQAVIKSSAHNIDPIHLQGLPQVVIDQLIAMNLACKGKLNAIINLPTGKCVLINATNGKKIVQNLVAKSQLTKAP
jgi:hypothetical protein